MDDNPNVNDNLDTDTSDNWPDKNLSGEMLLTVAYVKNESKSNALDYYSLNSKGNIRGQHFMDINGIKTERTDTCSENNSRDVNNDVNVKVHVKEESQHHYFQEHGIHHVTNIAQHIRVGERDTRDMGDDCPSSATQSRNRTHKCIHKRVHSGETQFKCNEGAYSTTIARHLKTHKLKHSGGKPYKCDECAYSTTRSEFLKTNKLIHSEGKPYKCDECAYSTTGSFSRHIN